MNVSRIIFHAGHNCFCIASKIIPGLLFTSRRPSPDATFVLDLQNTAKNSDFDCCFFMKHVSQNLFLPRKERCMRRFQRLSTLGTDIATCSGSLNEEQRLAGFGKEDHEKAAKAGEVWPESVLLYCGLVFPLAIDAKSRGLDVYANHHCIYVNWLSSWEVHITVSCANLLICETRTLRHTSGVHLLYSCNKLPLRLNNGVYSCGSETPIFLINLQWILVILLRRFVIRIFRGTCSSVKMLKGYMASKRLAIPAA